MKSFDRPRTGNLRVAKRLTQGPRRSKAPTASRSGVSSVTRKEFSGSGPSSGRCRSRCGVGSRLFIPGRKGPQRLAPSSSPAAAAPRSAPVSGGPEPFGRRRSPRRAAVRRHKLSGVHLS